MTAAKTLRVLRTAARHDGAQIDLQVEPGGEALCARIGWLASSLPGSGEEALRRLCQAADQLGVLLRIARPPAEAVKVQELLGRHGFVMSESAVGDLVREALPGRSSTLKEKGRTQSFDDWLDGSKVVNDRGEPLILYHGTTAVVDDFDLSFSGSDGIQYALPAVFATTDPELASEYALNKFNRNIADAMRSLQRHKNLNPGDYGPEYEACYQAVRSALAQARGVGEFGGGANVMPVLMSLRNPLQIDAAGLRAMDVLPQAIPRAATEGHDGLIVRNLVDRAVDNSNNPADVYIALSSSRVKSAIAYRGAASAREQAVMYSFAGKRSATAHLDGLTRAWQWLDEGGDPELVRRETGWHVGIDGQPRYEISDHLAFLKGTGTFGEILMARRAALRTEGPTYLPDVLYHPELFDAYPSLREIEVRFVPTGVRANARIGDDVFLEVRETLPAGDALSSILHETQHLIQIIERFAPGGSPGEAFADGPAQSVAIDIYRSMLVDAIRPLTFENFAAGRLGAEEAAEDARLSYQQYLAEHERHSTSPAVGKDVEKRAAMVWYRRLAGEIEARNVQARQHLDIQARRVLPPSMTADRVPEQAIVLPADTRRQEHLPLVPRVFHGTSQDFDAFAPNERGLFFAEDRDRAAAYVAVRKGACARVIEAELDIRKPWSYIYYGLDVPYRDMVDQSPAALMAQGYDGTYMAREQVWVAFRPEQVRVVASHPVELPSRATEASPVAPRGFGESPRFSHAQGTGDISSPFDFSTDARFQHLFYGQPTPQEIRAFSAWLRGRPNDFVRLYHGTAAVNPIYEKGILPTSTGRRNSIQSSSGYVYLSVFPGMARDFGRYAALNRPAADDGARVAVYPVTRTIRSLLADLDQLRNRRHYSGEHVGNSLAESLVHGRGARVRGRVDVSSLGPALRYRARELEAMSGQESVADGLQGVAVHSRARPLIAGHEDGILYSFAGEQAATADLVGLGSVRAAVRGGASPEEQRARLGWFKGADQRWRFEIDDSGARLLPALRSLHRGGYPSCTIASVTYRPVEGGGFDVCLNPPNPQRTDDFIHLYAASRELVAALLPADALLQMVRGEGEEDLIGDFEEGRRLEHPFEFGGMNVLALDQVLHHPLLFKAYPALRSLCVQVDPSLGLGAALVSLEDGTHVLRVGRAHQLSNMMHEIQHAIQTIEGFAMGGSPGVFRDRQSTVLPIEIINEALTIAELSTTSGQPVSSIRQRPPRVLRDASDAAWDLAAVRSTACLRREFGVALTSLSPLESYMRLAGEVEARNVQRRLGFDEEKRRQLAPSTTADRAEADLLLEMEPALPEAGVRPRE